MINHVRTSDRTPCTTNTVTTRSPLLWKLTDETAVTTRAVLTTLHSAGYRDEIRYRTANETGHGDLEVPRPTIQMTLTDLSRSSNHQGRGIPSLSL
jgi:hypothetical protein